MFVECLRACCSNRMSPKQKQWFDGNYRTFFSLSSMELTIQDQNPKEEVNAQSLVWQGKHCPKCHCLLNSSEVASFSKSFLGTPWWQRTASLPLSPTPLEGGILLALLGLVSMSPPPRSPPGDTQEVLSRGFLYSSFSLRADICCACNLARAPPLETPQPLVAYSLVGSSDQASKPPQPRWAHYPSLTHWTHSWELEP